MDKGGLGLSPATPARPLFKPVLVRIRESLSFSRSARSPTVERGDAPAISRLPAESAAFPRRR
jgi:hypothetical protein